MPTWDEMKMARDGHLKPGERLGHRRELKRSEQKETALPVVAKVRRPITEREKQQAEALCLCTLPVGSWHKRFVRSLPDDEITDAQGAWLNALAWRYRRQLIANGHASLVPPEKPQPFTTESAVISSSAPDKTEDER